MRLNLEWKILDAADAALIFAKPTWTVFQSTADSRGMDTCDMMTAALAKLLGPIMARHGKD